MYELLNSKRGCHTYAYVYVMSPMDLDGSMAPV
jgi:hypothetical protein